MYRITKTDGDQIQTIASCLGHIPRTMIELKTKFVTIHKVEENEPEHTCMGCLKGWNR